MNFDYLQLSDDGQFNEDGAKTQMDLVYPDQYKEEALTKMKECATTHCKLAFKGFLK